MRKQIVLMFLFLTLPLLAQQRSAKRGVCWDEKTQPLTDAPIQKMAPGISWLYTWGAAPVGTASLLGSGADGMAFLPMCWNADFNETQLRSYLSAHQGEVRYLLAFNEPNLSWNVGGSAMTPQQAATAWPRVEQVAQDFGLQIVAPALNFTGDNVGGRVWEPFAWYDEFFRLVPNAKVDYLCFHSYMNYFSAVNWVASEYFYTDKESSDLFHADNKSKYPNLVKYLEDYKEANGHFPRMFLTEFCAYQGNEYPYTQGITLDFQIDQMTQKVQKLEQSDLVAGYAWFMGNIGKGATAWPYMSIFQTNTASSELSTLGQVYVNMSSFDTSLYYKPGQTIQAKDYVDASTDNQQVKLRPNTQTGSEAPLQVEYTANAWAIYQVSVPADGDYELQIAMKSEADNRLMYDLDQNRKWKTVTLPSTAGQWQQQSVTLSLTAGEHQLRLFNSSTTSLFLSTIAFKADPTGISRPVAEDAEVLGCFDLQGRRLQAPGRGLTIVRERRADGRVVTTKRF